jgi:hypothetical protein
MVKEGGGDVQRFRPSASLTYHPNPPPPTLPTNKNENENDLMAEMAEGMKEEGQVDWKVGQTEE